MPSNFGGANRAKMSQRHEKDIVKALGGRKNPGSGNQWKNQLDGRHDHHDPFAFAWDCKATLGASIAVSRTMWAKVAEQAAGERPMVPLRFYDTADLDVGLDLVVVTLADFTEMRNELRDLRREVDRMHGRSILR